MNPRLTLSGFPLQSLRGVHVCGQYRYLPESPNDRSGEGCTVLQLARQTPGRAGDALVEFADGHQQVVPWASLRSLREKYPRSPLELASWPPERGSAKEADWREPRYR